MKARNKEQKTCSRGHRFAGSGPCPVCWPGSQKKRKSGLKNTTNTFDMRSQTISDEALQKATGRSRDEWFGLLKKIRAEVLSHKEIARKLYDEYGVESWWAQTITVEYERSIGRREVGQTCYGDHQASASKTVAGDMDNTLESWKKLIGKEKAFNNVAFSSDPSISKTDKWRYWRVNLVDGTKVTVVIGDKDTGKAQVAVNHEKISDKKAADHWKSYWKEFLKGLTIKTAT